MKNKRSWEVKILTWCNAIPDVALGGDNAINMLARDDILT